MSRLNELIQELCPNGVEHKTLSELFNTRNGYTPSRSNQEFWTNGTIPWFRMEDIRENGRILSEATQYVSESAVKGNLFPANSIIVATSATIGEHALITVPSLANQRFTYLMLKDQYKDMFDVKFLYYYCFKLDIYCKECLNQGNFASVDMKKFAKFEFPLVPLEVQREIVRILDNFTELTARKKQYEYYRRKLLTFGEDIPVFQIKEIGTVSIGEFVHKSKQNPNAQYPVFNGGISNTGFYNDFNRTANKVIISARGANAGFVNRVFTNFWSGNSCYTIDIPNGKVDWNYAYFWMKSNETKLLGDQQKGGIPAISKKQVEEFQIPVPPIEEQRRIVSILDKFDMLATSISEGLPKEIELRRKQYEYYRNQLLSFPDNKATA